MLPLSNSAYIWTKKNAWEIHKDAKITVFDNLVVGDSSFKCRYRRDQTYVSLTHLLNELCSAFASVNFLSLVAASSGFCPLVQNFQWFIPSSKTSGNVWCVSHGHGDQMQGSFTASPMFLSQARPTAPVLHRWAGAMQEVWCTLSCLNWLCTCRFPVDRMFVLSWMFSAPWAWDCPGHDLWFCRIIE